MKRSETTHRDQLVGEAIRKLTVPHPRDGFFEDVRQGLDRGDGGPRHLVELARAKVGDRIPPVGLRALLATAIASAAVGGVIGASVSGAAENRTSPPPTRVSGHDLSFAPAAGWNTLEANLMIRSDSAPVAWAANVGFEPESDYSGFPDATVGALPVGGIVISVLGPRPVTEASSFSDISEPLQISADSCVTSYDGQPKPYIALCPIDRRLGTDQVLNVLVWIGADAAGAKPSQELIDAANKELARLTVPG